MNWPFGVALKDGPDHLVVGSESHRGWAVTDGTAELRSLLTGKGSGAAGAFHRLRAVPPIHRFTGLGGSARQVCRADEQVDAVLPVRARMGIFRTSPP